MATYHSWARTSHSGLPSPAMPASNQALAIARRSAPFARSRIGPQPLTSGSPALARKGKAASQPPRSRIHHLATLALAIGSSGLAASLASSVWQSYHSFCCRTSSF